MRIHAAPFLFGLPNAVLAQGSVHRIGSKIGTARPGDRAELDAGFREASGIGQDSEDTALGEWMSADISTVPSVPSKNLTQRL
jgi:hypothetical protein